MTIDIRVVAAGIVLTGLVIAGLVLLAEVRLLRRPTPPRSVAVVPRRFEDAPPRQLFDVAPAPDMDATAVQFVVRPENPTVVLPRHGGHRVAR